MREQISKSVKIGCCGFPRSQERYSREFHVIEIQRTFYQLPRIDTVERWRRKAPIDFEFTLKAWQLITHRYTSPTYRRVRGEIPEGKKSCYDFFQPTPEVFEAWHRTLKIAEALKARIVIFQSPASFKSTESNKKNIREFFQSVNREGLIFCWEPRGDWNQNEIYKICSEYNLVNCVDPFVRDSTFGSIRYYRLHGIGGFQYRYTDADLASLLRKYSQSQIMYVMFNNISMWEDAFRFQKLFTEQFPIESEEE